MNQSKDEDPIPDAPVIVIDPHDKSRLTNRTYDLWSDDPGSTIVCGSVGSGKFLPDLDPYAAIHGNGSSGKSSESRSLVVVDEPTDISRAHVENPPRVDPLPAPKDSSHEPI